MRNRSMHRRIRSAVVDESVRPSTELSAFLGELPVREAVGAARRTTWHRIVEAGIGIKIVLVVGMAGAASAAAVGVSSTIVRPAAEPPLTPPPAVAPLTSSVPAPPPSPIAPASTPRGSNASSRLEPDDSVAALPSTPEDSEPTDIDADDPPASVEDQGDTEDDPPAVTDEDPAAPDDDPTPSTDEDPPAPEEP